jgi:hypothetical protein
MISSLPTPTITHTPRFSGTFILSLGGTGLDRTLSEDDKARKDKMVSRHLYSEKVRYEHKTSIKTDESSSFDAKSAAKRTDKEYQNRKTKETERNRLGGIYNSMNTVKIKK